MLSLEQIHNGKPTDLALPVVLKLNWLESSFSTSLQSLGNKFTALSIHRSP